MVAVQQPRCFSLPLPALLCCCAREPLGAQRAHQFCSPSNAAAAATSCDVQRRRRHPPPSNPTTTSPILPEFARSPSLAFSRALSVSLSLSFFLPAAPLTTAFPCMTAAAAALFLRPVRARVERARAASARARALTSPAFDTPPCLCAAERQAAAAAAAGGGGSLAARSRAAIFDSTAGSPPVQLFATHTRMTRRLMTPSLSPPTHSPPRRRLGGGGRHGIQHARVCLSAACPLTPVLRLLWPAICGQFLATPAFVCVCVC